MNPNILLSNLLDTEDLTTSQLEGIFKLASHYKNNKNCNLDPNFKNKTIGFLFYEPSTRTKGSFYQAAQKLNLKILDFSPSTCSVVKGESLIDTANNLISLGVDIFVLRHKQSGSALFLSKNINKPVINAGDGMHAHPTQALLDAYTLLENFNSLKNKNIAIIGDIRHSRVARSNIYILKNLGALVTLVGPPTFLPEEISKLGVKVTNKVEDVLDFDVIMPLRIQKERQLSGYIPSLSEYSKFFGLNDTHLSEINENSIIMHPGPINRGVELSSSVADCDKSVILEQVSNGVYIRMALITILLGGKVNE